MLFCWANLLGKGTKAPLDSALIKSAEQLANSLLGIISAMDRRDQERLLPERDGDDGSRLYGDSLLPFFGPYPEGKVAESEEVVVYPRPPFRPHVLA